LKELGSFMPGTAFGYLKGESTGARPLGLRRRGSQVRGT